LIAYITVYIQDAAAVKMHGFFGGYNTIVWTVIIVQAVGGLIVATVVKVCSCASFYICNSKKRFVLKNSFVLLFSLNLSIAYHSTRTTY
jgi:Nucleotide-sugar transporter